MLKSKIIFLLLTYICLCACASSVPEDMYDPPIKHIPGNGYFVVSVTSNSSRSALFYRHQGEKQYKWIYGMNSAASNCDFSCTSEDNSENGRVVAVAVPPGSYEINGFGQSEPRGDDWNTGWHKDTDLPALKFEVNSNEVVYLGGLRSIKVSEKSYFTSVKSTLAVVGYFKDMQARDLNAFKNKYPSLQSLPLTVKILSDREWDSGREIYTVDTRSSIRRKSQ